MGLKKAAKPVLDALIGKLISRKLTVFIIATFFAYIAYLTPEQWMEIAKLYIGVQSVIDVTTVIKNKPPESTEGK